MGEANDGREVVRLRLRSRLRLRACIAVLLLAALGCATTPRSRRSYGSFRLPPDPAEDATRYRLQLRHNPLDPGEAFRCYGSCQSELTPRGYFDCLSACPAFEVTQHEVCAKEEVPPVAACFTVRKIPARSERPSGLLVLGVIGAFLLVITAESLCASSQAYCAHQNRYTR